MNYRDLKKELKRIIEKADKNEEWYEIIERDDEEKFEQLYLGSFMSLDPCGKYHCVLVPNEPTKKCDRFWDNLEKTARELNCWVENGEGDYTDVFLTRIKEKEDENE